MKRDILYRLFEITGNEKDALVYLKTFKSFDPEKFALIHIDSTTISEFGESVLFDLKILHRLGLFPIIVISEIATEYIRLFFKPLIEWGTVLDENKLHCDFIPIEGEILSNIKNTIQGNKIPFLVYSHTDWETPIIQILNEIKSQKLIFLETERIFFDEITEKPISLIHLRNDYEKFRTNLSHSANDIIVLDRFKKLLEMYSAHLRSISITSPIALLRELFTVKGSGTYIKLGSQIQKIQNKSEIDLSRLKVLMERAFRKKIKPDFLHTEFDSIFLETNYRGAAIMKYSPIGVILSKFAVDEIARGEGIGREIWEKIRENYQTIFWRANPFNPINKWYTKECDGMFKFSKWIIYWIGASPGLIPEICEILNNQPADFYE